MASSLGSIHASKPSRATKNINRNHLNTSKSISSVIDLENSVVSSSFQNAKRKFPDDETVICISDDESNSDKDVICLEPDKYSKPLYICEPEAPSCKNVLPKVERDISSDIIVLNEMMTFRPRKTMKKERTSICKDEPCVIIEKVVGSKFSEDIHALSASDLSNDGQRIVPRNVFVNDKKTENNSLISVEKIVIKNAPGALKYDYVSLFKTNGISGKNS